MCGEMSHIVNVSILWALAACPYSTVNLDQFQLSGIMRKSFVVFVFIIARIMLDPTHNCRRICFFELTNMPKRHGVSRLFHGIRWRNHSSEYTTWYICSLRDQIVLLQQKLHYQSWRLQPNMRRAVQVAVWVLLWLTEEDAVALVLWYYDSGSVYLSW